MIKNILVTGGAGYIGSHMVLLLLEKGYTPIILDNYSTSDNNNLRKIEEMKGIKLQIIKHDIRNSFDNVEIPEVDAIIHFAAFKAVPDSIAEPILYYENNVWGTVNLLKWAKTRNIKRFIFSSSSAVYGDAPDMPVTEKTPTIPLSPYGRSKLFMEHVIKDFTHATSGSSVILRYFNVAGNVDDGSIGDQQKNPVAVIPALICSHLGYRKSGFTIFGSDYDTRDGSAVRDFIHVMDLVDAHLKALLYLENHEGTYTFNLGTKNGITLLEAIKSFEEVTGQKLQYTMGDRRTGDIIISIADASLAQKELGWVPAHDINDIMRSSWNWYTKGFKDLQVATPQN